MYPALYEKSDMVLIPTLSDGHCIQYSMQNCLQYLENKVVPTIQEMFSLLKYEILQHVDFYSGFLNNVDTDFLDDLEQYEKEKRFSNNTNDIVISALSNIFECTIVLLENKDDNSYIMQNQSRDFLYPARAGRSISDVFFERTGNHYQSLIKCTRCKQILMWMFTSK